jgi:hypothetical protein
MFPCGETVIYQEILQAQAAVGPAEGFTLRSLKKGFSKACCAMNAATTPSTNQRQPRVGATTPLTTPSTTPSATPSATPSTNRRQPRVGASTCWRPRRAQPSFSTVMRATRPASGVYCVPSSWGWGVAKILMLVLALDMVSGQGSSQPTTSNSRYACCHSVNDLISVNIACHT